MNAIENGLVDAESYAEHLKRIAAFPEDLKAVVHAIPPARMHESYREGGWSATQVVNHILDSHLNILYRIKMALTADQPHVPPYDQDAWALLPDYSAELIDNCLVMVENLHLRATALFEALSDEQRKRSFYHAKHDKWVSVDESVAKMASNGPHHLEQLKRIVQEGKPAGAQPTTNGNRL